MILRAFVLDVHPEQPAPMPTGFGGTALFLAQEYKHVLLARNLRTLEQYEDCERRGLGSALPVPARALVRRTTEEFTGRLGADGLRTCPGTCAEAADLLEAGGPRYRHVVVDEAQDLHPVQWRLLRSAAPARPDDLFVACTRARDGLYVSWWGEPSEFLVEAGV